MSSTTTTNNNVEVNGTESDALPTTAFGDMQELNSSVVEVNGIESEVLSMPMEFDAFEGNFCYNVQEVNASVEVNEVNGIESVVLPVTFDALGNFSYKNDVQEVNSSKVESIVLVQELNSSHVESIGPIQEVNSSQVESIGPIQEVNSSQVESIVSVQEVNSSQVESIVLVQEVNSSVAGSFVPVQELTSSVAESFVPVQELNTSVVESSVLAQEVNSSVVEPIVPVPELNSSMVVEPIVPVQELNYSQVESVVPVHDVNSSMVESIISTNGVSPMRGVPIERPEQSNSPKSPHSTALNDVTMDHQESIENKSRSVTPGNVGRGKSERLRENGVRRSPRLLSPVDSSPQIGGTKTNGLKLKRIRSSVDEGNVEGGNGSCEKVALIGSSDRKQSKRKKVYVFVGEPVPEHEAQERWGWRYELKGKRCKGWSGILNAGQEDEVHVNVECHYLQANVNGCIFSLGDCAHIKGEGRQPHVGRIVEFFKTTDDENYFRVQWFFRAEDTVMKEAAAFHDKKRLFYSTLRNDNLLECILSKVKVIEKAPMLGFQSTSIQPSEYYCDMEYSVKYSTFRSLVTGKRNVLAIIICLQFTTFLPH